MRPDVQGWVVSAGASDSDVGRGIAVDNAGNSYVTGLFLFTTTFGSTTLTAKGGGGSGDVFVAKLSPSGKFLWVVSAGGGSWDFGWGIAVDNAGNSYVTGAFVGPATFGSTTLT